MIIEAELFAKVTGIEPFPWPFDRNDIEILDVPEQTYSYGSIGFIIQPKTNNTSKAIKAVYDTSTNKWKIKETDWFLLWLSYNENKKHN